jgi:MFS family permease
MAVLDTTIVSVALPSIAQGIKASSDTLEWGVSGYALTFGLALVPAGRLGDRLGYKQMFLGGVVGISTALGPLIGGLLIQVVGMSDGWRWVFLVNLFIGMVEIPVAVKVIPADASGRSTTWTWWAAGC